jgi:rhodanese-related sulfurtransferase
MTTVTVTPAEINAQHGKPVLLIDIRSHDEWRREHISGTRSLPLEQLHAGCFSETGLSETDTVIFHCQSGMRTGNAAEKLSQFVYPAQALIMQEASMPGKRRATRLSLIAVSHYHSCDKYRLPQGRWPSAEVWADYS